MLKKLHYAVTDLFFNSTCMFH